MTRIILVRHGQTEWNNGSRFQGHLDSPLTPAGILQVEALGRRLGKEQIAAIYSSDLGRAQHTAELIAKSIHLPVNTDVRLRERALGIFQGLTRADIAERFPAETKAYFSRDPNYIVPQGESALGRFELGLNFLNEIAAAHHDGNIVAVTHGGIVQGMFRFVNNIAFDTPRRFAIRNAAYNSFLHTKDGWSLETWGDISHYPAETSERGFPVEKQTPEVL